MDIVISPAYVKLHKVLGHFQLVNELGDEWEQIAVFDCDCIQLLIVLYRTQPLILFFNKEEWQHKGGFRRMNVTRLEILLKESIKFLLFIG